mmetsp:Transcript_121650/g.344134  ORF Transcript_121650/g.344134 Transcript_121650/m.344134 type:complete len:80 (+) Transcript_121650:85-324(+)
MRDWRHVCLTRQCEQRSELRKREKVWFAAVRGAAKVGSPGTKEAAGSGAQAQDTKPCAESIDARPSLSAQGKTVCGKQF